VLQRSKTATQIAGSAIRGNDDLNRRHEKKLSANPI
jgi:hypothetical protein